MVSRKSKSSTLKSLFGRFTLAESGRTEPPKPPFTAGATSALRSVGAVGLLTARTFAMLFTAKLDKRETWRIAHRFTNDSAFFIVVAMSFVGMIMVYQSTQQLSRAVGDTQLVGAAFLKLLVRVLGPTVIGLLLACRVGAGIAAEIAAMAVTDQLDAMRMCAADPVEVLMVPRLRAGIIASLTLVIIGSVASAFAGLATGTLLFSMNSATYWNFTLVEFSDLIQGLAKAVAYGIAVPIVSGVFGLAARGGARGVGQATTDAVVGSSFAIVVLDSLITLISHVVTGK